MKEKEQNTVVGQLLILDLFSILIGYYFITTIDEFVKQHEWWYDLLVLLIVICEVVYNWIQLMKVKDKIKKLPIKRYPIIIKGIFRSNVDRPGLI